LIDRANIFAHFLARVCVRAHAFQCHKHAFV